MDTTYNYTKERQLQKDRDRCPQLLQEERQAPIAISILTLRVVPSRRSDKTQAVFLRLAELENRTINRFLFVDGAEFRSLLLYLFLILLQSTENDD